MMQDRPVKRKLSKSILEMKFMRASKVAALRAEEEEEGRAVFANDQTKSMRMGGQCIIEPSFVPCIDLLNCRMSFHGMNPELELQMHKEREQANPLPENDVEITASEMAKTLKNMKTDNTVRKPAKKKKKFLKPSEDD